jgi:hypothetical protein
LQLCAHSLLINMADRPKRTLLSLKVKVWFVWEAPSWFLNTDNWDKLVKKAGLRLAFLTYLAVFNRNQRKNTYLC